MKVQPKTKFFVTILDLTWGLDNVLEELNCEYGLRLVSNTTEAQYVLWEVLFSMNFQ